MLGLLWSYVHSGGSKETIKVPIFLQLKSSIAGEVGSFPQVVGEYLSPFTILYIILPHVTIFSNLRSRLPKRSYEKIHAHVVSPSLKRVTRTQNVGPEAVIFFLHKAMQTLASFYIFTH